MASSGHKLLCVSALFFIPCVAVSLNALCFRITWLGLCVNCIFGYMWTLGMSTPYLKLSSINHCATLLAMWTVSSALVYLAMDITIFQPKTPVISPVVGGIVWCVFALAFPVALWRFSPAIYSAYCLAKQHKLLSSNVPPPLAYVVVLLSCNFFCYFYTG